MKTLAPTYRWVSAVVVAAMLFGIAVPVVQHACMAQSVMQDGIPMHHADDRRSGDHHPGVMSAPSAHATPATASHEAPHRSGTAHGASYDASHRASSETTSKPCCCDGAASPCTGERPTPDESDLLTGTPAPSSDLSACCAQEAQVHAVLSSVTVDRLIPESAATVELSGLDAASSVEAKPIPLFASLSDDPSPSSVRLHVWTATFLK